MNLQTMTKILKANLTGDLDDPGDRRLGFCMEFALLGIEGKLGEELVNYTFLAHDFYILPTDKSGNRSFYGYCVESDLAERIPFYNNWKFSFSHKIVQTPNEQIKKLKARELKTLSDMSGRLKVNADFFEQLCTKLGSQETGSLLSNTSLCDLADYWFLKTPTTSARFEFKGPSGDVAYLLTIPSAHCEDIMCKPFP